LRSKFNYIANDIKPLGDINTTNPYVIKGKLNKFPANDFNFDIDISDTLLVLTRNNSVYKEKVSNIVSKMVIIKELQSINLENLSKWLDTINIKKLNIFCINNELNNDINYVETKKNCIIKYFELNTDVYKNNLNSNSIFFDENKHSLYIIRGGNFLDIKNLFAVIENYPTNLGRGGSQKSHMLSHLELRLSSYLMAMFNFDYNLIQNLNTFNYINKERYLS
jgi:hypothetical protein